MKLEDRNLIFVDKQDKEDRRLRYPWRCTNKIQRNGENRELPTPPSNRKVMEAAESGGCANCDRRSIESCIRYVRNIHLLS